jgi:glycopeptide antibiotics resistance protein
MEVFDCNEVMWSKCLIPCIERRIGGSVHFVITQFHGSKGIFIKTEPNMQSMFFNALPHRSIAPARAFASQTPSHLIHGNIVFFLPIWGFC